MKKKLIKLFLVLVVLLGLGVFLRNRFLPRTIEKQLQSFFKEQLQLKVTTDGVSFQGLTGAKVENIKVFSSDEKLLLYIPKVSADFLLPFTGGSLFALKISLNEPEFSLKRDEQGVWNIQEIISKLQKDPQDKKDKKKPKTLFKRISVNDLKLHFSDSKEDVEFFLQDVDVDINLDVKANVNFSLKTESDVLNIDCKGVYSLLQKEASLNFAVVDFSPLKFKSYFSSMPEYLKEILVKEMISKVTFSKGVLEAEGSADLQNISGGYENINVQGNLISRFSTKYNLKDKNLDYRAENNLGTLQFKGVPRVDLVYLTEGTFVVEKGEVIFSELKGNALDKDFNISGTLKDFSNPELDLLGDYQLPLSEIEKLIKKDLGFKATGEVSTKFSVKGPLKDSKNLLIKVDGKSPQVAIEADALKKPLILSSLDFSYDTQKDSLNWEVKKIPFLNVLVACQGTLSNIKSPEVNFNLKSDEIDVRGKINFDGTKIKDYSLKGPVFESALDYSGKAVYLGDVLYLKGKGTIDFNMKTLVHLMKKETYDKISARGDVAIDLETQVNTEDFSTFTLSGEARSSNIRAYELKSDNMKAAFSYQDKELTLSPLSAIFYDGVFDLRTKFNFDTRGAVLNFVAENVNLEGITKELLPKEKRMKGFIDIQIDMETKDFQDNSKLLGQGIARIRDGELWKMNLFKQLGKLIFVPDFKQITFTDGQGEFIIKDSNLVVDYLKLNSQAMILKGQGKVGFDKSINFMFFPEVKSEIVGLSDDARKISSIILGQGAFTIQVTGTLDKPKMKMESFVTSPVQEFKDILEGIFN